MTLDLIRNIIEGYIKSLRDADSLDNEYTQKRVAEAKARLIESFDILQKMYPELVQVNMQGIVGEEYAEEFISRLKFNSGNRYSLDFIPTGNYFHDKINGEDIYTPEYIKWQDENNPYQNIVINYSDNTQDAARYILNNLILNILISLPIDTVHLSIIDPKYTGMGSIFTENLTSKFYHDEIIVKNDSSFFNRIKYLTEHISKTITKYGDLISYNNKHEYIAMPYELVLLNCYPYNYDAYIEELMPLFENGNKYGVYFIVMNNQDYSLRREDQKHLLNIPNYQTIVPSNTTKSPQGLVSLTPICQNHQLLKVCFKYINKGEKIEPRSKQNAQSIQVQKLNKSDIEYPIGTKIERSEMLFKLDQDSHVHSFIIGRSGSGKSVLLNNIIMGAISTYTPEELQLYLLDFKLGGVEFNRYKNIKHARALLVDNSDIQVILEILRDLNEQMKERGKILRNAGVLKIDDYNNSHKESKMPHIWVVIDECQVVFEQHISTERKARTEISDIITKVATEGRSQGVHLIMATQTLANADIPAAILNNITDRYILNCAPIDAEKMWANSSRLVNKLGNGDVYYHHTSNEFPDTQFHAFYHKPDESETLIEKVINETTSHKSNGQFYFDGSQIFQFDQETIHVLSNARKGNLKANPGKSVSLKQIPVSITLQQDMRENILITGIDNQDQSTRTAMDILYSLVICNIKSEQNYNIYVVDYKDNEEGEYQYVLEHLKKLDLITIVQKNDVGALLKQLVNGIQSCTVDSSILLVLGQQRFNDLKFDSVINEKKEDSNTFFGSNGFISSTSAEIKTYKQALSYILDNGPEFHIHTVLQVDKPSNLLFEDYVTSKFVFKKFRHLIMLKSDDKAALNLGLPDEIRLDTLNSEPERLRAIYYADGDDGWTLFSPFAIPNKNELSNLTNKQ